jgi:hypothetical protein
VSHANCVRRAPNPVSTLHSASGVWRLASGVSSPTDPANGL